MIAGTETTISVGLDFGRFAIPTAFDQAIDS